MEEFERKHNFRFEEEDSNLLITHARELPNTLRRKDETRINARKALKERKIIEKKQKKERLAQLKNIKLKEVRERLDKIRKLAGADVLDIEELEGDFDPDAYDKKMEMEFGTEYYDQEGGKPEFADDVDIDDIINGNYEKEDDHQAHVLFEDEEEDEEKPHKKSKKNKKELVACEDSQFNMDCDAPPKKKNKKKTKALKMVAECEDPDFNMDCDAPQKPQKIKANLIHVPEIAEPVVDPMEELYPLDYEDIIDDLPTRFKYRTVPAESYALTPDELIAANDDDLNQLISLKKLAPYRSEAKQEADATKWRKSKKKKLWEFRSKMKGKVFDVEEEEKAKAKAGVDGERMESYLSKGKNKGAKKRKLN